MAEYGHVKLSRKAFATDRFWNEPREFSKWEAWIWMIQAAAWKDHQRVIGMTLIPLERGEFIASIRFLAKAWGWSPKKVRNFLALGSEMDRIRAQRETHFGTVYSVVNYARYQDTDPQTDTEKGTVGAQSGHSKGTKEKQLKQEKNNSTSDSEKTDLFDTAWAMYPKRPGNNKRAARRAWDARIKSGVDPAAILDGIQRYAAYIEAKHTDPEHVKMAATFFGPDEHWKSDYVTNGNPKEKVIIWDEATMGKFQ